MATRIQVRRGTNTQWNTTDPILNIGEFGYSTTDSQFKIGDGTTIWSLLDYVPSATSLGSSLGDYIELTEKSAIDGVAELDGSKNILAPAGIIFEGTADAHETTLTVTDPTADRTITLPNTSGTVITTGNLSDITNIGVFSSTITMEGSTADAHELTLSAGDPTADRTITFPDATGTVVLADGSGNVTVSGNLTVSGTTTTINSTTINATTGIIFEGLTADAYETTLTVTDPTADRTITFPDATGTVQLRVTDVSDTEIGYLNGVTSAIQTQIDAKAPLASPTFTGTVTLPSGTVTSTMIADGTIADADINASAAIALSKLATDPLARANHTGSQTASTISDFNEAAQDAIGGILGTGLTYNDASNTITVDSTNIQLRVANVTDTEIGYLDGVTSAIQTQLDARVEESLFDAKGDILVASADNTPAKLSVGTNGYILTANTSAATGIEWAAAPVGYSPPTLGSTQIGSGATVTTISGLTLSSPIVSGLAVSDASIVFEGATANDFETTLTVTDPTQDRTITFPNATGTVALAENVAALSGATFTGAISGTSLTHSGNLTINGTTTTINSTTLTVDDKNIVLADGNTSDASADGGGITLSGATNKTFNWVDATDAWTSSEHMNLLTGKSYKINGTAISTALPALTWGDVKNGKSSLVIS